MVENFWCGETYPRMREWVDNYYPGIRLPLLNTTGVQRNILTVQQLRQTFSVYLDGKGWIWLAVG